MSRKASPPADEPPQPAPEPRLACCGGRAEHKRTCKVCPPLYEPTEGEHPALVRRCPACGARRGQWCGGLGDVHVERMNAKERRERQAELEAQARAVLALERALQAR